MMHPNTPRLVPPFSHQESGILFNDAEETSGDEVSSEDETTSDESQDLGGALNPHAAKNLRWIKEELTEIKEKAQTPIRFSESIEAQNRKTLEGLFY